MSTVIDAVFNFDIYRVNKAIRRIEVQKKKMKVWESQLLSTAENHYLIIVMNASYKAFLTIADLHVLKVGSWGTM